MRGEERKRVPERITERTTTAAALKERSADTRVLRLAPHTPHASLVTAAICAALISACGSQPPRPVEDSGIAAPSSGTPEKPVTKRGGGYYLDDGPGDNEPPPEVLAATPDAIPRQEPLNRHANKPYTVLGQTYVPIPPSRNYKVTGVASWYGKKFHGQKTSSGEPYDMYAMTAAHPTLPIPSYVRVTNPANGKSVIVRVNDRGPFHSNRIIDLSFTAAWKLGYIGSGSTPVTVELLHPGRDTQLAAADTVAAPTATLAPAPAAEPAPAPAITAPAPGVYIQLGAFSNPDNAEAFRSHMARELDWLADRLRLEAGGNMMRVQIGPFASRAEADSHAERIQTATGLKPTIVTR